MVGVKEAVESARTFVQDVIGSKEVRRLTLEEVELSEDGNDWLVTLGLALDDPFDLLNPGKPEKSVKRFRVNGASGQVLSMTSADRQ